MEVERLRVSARLAAFLVLGCLVPTIARTQPASASSFPPVPVSDASTKALQVVGNYLFVAAWGRGLQVLDISNPAHPRWAGAWNPRRCVTGVHIVGNRAYLANRIAGFNILDVTNPKAPVPLGALDFKGDAHVVYVAGDCAYVGENPRGLRVIDVKDPRHPVLLATVALPGTPRSIQVSGNYVCFTADPGSLQIYDMHDPRNPALLSKRTIWTGTERLQIVGHHAYVTTFQGGLMTFDLTVPAHPQPVDALMSHVNDLPIVVPLTNGWRQIGEMWMLTNANWRPIVEKKFPSNAIPDISHLVEVLRDSAAYPQTLTRIAGMTSHFHGLHIMEHYALTLSTNLEVLDLSGIMPKRIGACEVHNPTWDIRGAGGYAYVMDWGANIQVVDLRGLTNPVVVGRFDSRGYVSSILAVPQIGKPVTAAPPERYADTPMVTGPPELTEPARLPDGGFAFTLVGAGDATYVVHASADMITWAPISTNALPATGRLRITDAEAQANPHRFYRAVKQ